MPLTVCTSTRNGLECLLTFTVVFGMGYSWQEALQNGLHLWCDFIDNHIDKCSEDDHRVIPDDPLRSAISAGWDFLGYVGIKNAGF